MAGTSPEIVGWEKGARTRLHVRPGRLTILECRFNKTRHHPQARLCAGGIPGRRLVATGEICAGGEILAAAHRDTGVGTDAGPLTTTLLLLVTVGANHFITPTERGKERRKERALRACERELGPRFERSGPAHEPLHALRAWEERGRSVRGEWEGALVLRCLDHTAIPTLAFRSAAS